MFKSHLPDKTIALKVFTYNKQAFQNLDLEQYLIPLTFPTCLIFIAYLIMLLLEI